MPGVRMHLPHFSSQPLISRRAPLVCPLLRWRVPILGRGGGADASRRRLDEMRGAVSEMNIGVARGLPVPEAWKGVVLDRSWAVRGPGATPAARVSSPQDGRRQHGAHSWPPCTRLDPPRGTGQVAGWDDAPGDAGSQGAGLACPVAPKYQEGSLHPQKGVGKSGGVPQPAPPNPTSTGLSACSPFLACVRWNHTRGRTPDGSCPSSCVRMCHVCPRPCTPSPIAPSLASRSRSPTHSPCTCALR